eukprot:gene6762-12328_t
MPGDNCAVFWLWIKPQDERIGYFPAFSAEQRLSKKMEKRSPERNHKKPEDKVLLRRNEIPYVVPKYEITIDDSLGYSISVYGWLLPDDHMLYLGHKRSVWNVTFSNLVSQLASFQLFPGISVTDRLSNVVNHVVPKHLDPLFAEEGNPFLSLEYHKTMNCEVLVTINKCSSCCEQDPLAKLSRVANDKRMPIPAKLKAPISGTSTERIKLTLNQQRLKCVELQGKDD